MLLAVDLGNSAVKMGVFDGDHLLAASRHPYGDLAGGLTVGAGRGRDFDEIVAVSVCEEGLRELEQALGSPVRVLGRDLPIPVENRYRVPGEVGADRLVNAVAAHALLGGAAVVVDLGSAVTVDAVSADGAFLGGAIGPGVRALASGLAGAAPALPPWDGLVPEPCLPRSTAAAIRAGIGWGLAGLVTRLVEEVGRTLPEGAPVVLTGGRADWAAPLLPIEVRVEDHLTLEGVRVCRERAGRGRCT